jgi:hypothetical protein
MHVCCQKLILAQIVMATWVVQISGVDEQGSQNAAPCILRDSYSALNLFETSHRYMALSLVIDMGKSSQESMDS